MANTGGEASEDVLTRPGFRWVEEAPRIRTVYLMKAGSTTGKESVAGRIVWVEAGEVIASVRRPDTGHEVTVHGDEDSAVRWVLERAL